ncbi:MAG: glycosyl transferase family 1 [Burkholderiales bacterium RIFCSPLOWO2_12_FULL_64_99]|nr:MAG: glycosyl transferase family 1 [Burkholderiales bacterium RIFCSPHIGHO2_12_FULL_63_20]OGB64525.1 MAG: glycosyl transferase family 1 [Burkholderiales bacterium RIFCSPLOWO2_12_FULL_64_99]
MRVLLFANTDWYLYNFRRSLALALRDAGHEVILLSPPGPYGAKLQSLGLEWHAAPMDRRSLNPLREIKLLRWLTQFMRAQQIDVVHGFTIKCAVYGSLAARWAGVPARVNAVAGMGYVFTSNDAKALILRPVVRSLLRLALGGKGARLILQNPDDVRLFQQAGLVDDTTIRLIPGSGVDCSRFAPTDSNLRQPGARMRVVLPARLLWDKGLAEFIDAARQLKAANKPIDLLLAGDPDPGNPAAVPEATVQQWVREGLVGWLGHVDDMPALFRSVDVVALPSYREGLPKGLIEAGASGLPLVTTDVPGCREVVTNNVDGLLVPVKNASALADALARLCDDPPLRARLGAAARTKALTEFDERIVIERTAAVYKELRH